MSCHLLCTSPLAKQLIRCRQVKLFGNLLTVEHACAPPATCPSYPPACIDQLMTSDLDERNITELSKFDAAVALEILEHYCAGDLSQVRNRRAYLAGKC